MAKAWRIIFGIVITMVLFGAVCLLVGKITGGDFQRILPLFEKRFDIPALKTSVSDALNGLLALIPLT